MSRTAAAASPGRARGPHERYRIALGALAVIPADHVGLTRTLAHGHQPVRHRGLVRLVGQRQAQVSHSRSARRRTTLDGWRHRVTVLMVDTSTQFRAKESRLADSGSGGPTSQSSRTEVVSGEDWLALASRQAAQAAAQVTGHADSSTAVTVESRRNVAVKRIVVWLLFAAIFGLVPVFAIAIKEALSPHAFQIAAAVKNGDVFIVCAVLAAGALGELIAAASKGKSFFGAVLGGFVTLAAFASETRGSDQARPGSGTCSRQDRHIRRDTSGNPCHLLLGPSC